MSVARHFFPLAQCLPHIDLHAVVGGLVAHDFVHVQQPLQTVLRQTDPRFLAMMDFAKKVIEDCPLAKASEICYRVVPKILKEHGETINPYPNLNANSGLVMRHFGIKELDFFTVAFGVARALGTTANLVWDRALGMPIERPASMTLENLEDLGKEKAT
jgi:citrate synthase